MTKILVMDKEEAIQFLYSEELSDEGYEVITAGDYSRFMELIEIEKPDLIVMEPKFFGDDGHDLLWNIRKKYNNIKVIVSSAYPAKNKDLKYISAEYYILKSLNLEKLKRKIEDALEINTKQKSKADHGIIKNIPAIPVSQGLFPWKAA